MNIKSIKLLLVISFFTSTLKSFSAKLYNNTGETLSISYRKSQEKTFSTKTLDYKDKILELENVDEIVLNKPENQSITIFSGAQDQKDSAFKTCIITGHTLKGENYSYSVTYKTATPKPYLIIQANDPVYGYKVSTKNGGAST